MERACEKEARSRLGRREGRSLRLPISAARRVVSAEVFHDALRDVIVCPISSHPRYFKKPGPGDHPLAHWKTVGLRHPSTARISNILAVDKRLIKRVLGAVPLDDLARIEQGMRQAFGLELRAK